jgi:hypothetical protein
VPGGLSSLVPMRLDQHPVRDVIGEAVRDRRGWMASWGAVLPRRHTAAFPLGKHSDLRAPTLSRADAVQDAHRASPQAARSVLDACEHDGILIAETDDDATHRSLPVSAADQDAPFKREFSPPITTGTKVADGHGPRGCGASDCPSRRTRVAIDRDDADRLSHQASHRHRGDDTTEDDPQHILLKVMLALRCGLPYIYATNLGMPK